MACSRESPHISADGLSELHTAGRSGWPKIAHALSAVSCTQRTPAGLLMPSTRGMPGMGDEMEGAMQQAPQPGRQFMRGLFGTVATADAGLRVQAVT